MAALVSFSRWFAELSIADCAMPSEFNEGHMLFLFRAHEPNNTILIIFVKLPSIPATS